MSDRRGSKRNTFRSGGINVFIASPDGSIIDRCSMADVSATGAKLVLHTEGEVPDRFDLLLSQNGKVRRQCIVARRNGKEIGVRFDFGQEPPAKGMAATVIDV
jgi:hypothetical protein